MDIQDIFFNLISRTYRNHFGVHDFMCFYGKTLILT